jgi:hypothetical protein
MRWYWQAGSSLVVGAVLASGCGTSRTLDLTPDLPRDIALRGAADTEAVTRSQKPDAHAAPIQPVAGTVLDQPPERSPEVSGSQPAARILATVNNEAILDTEVQAASYQLLAQLSRLPEPERSQQMAKANRQALDQLIEREVVLQDAFATLKARNPKMLDKLQGIATEQFEKQWLRVVRDSVGAKSDDEFKEILRAQGLSLPLVKRQWERNFMAMEYLRNRVFSSLDQIGHAQIEEYYTQHPDEFRVQDGVEWLDLFIDASRHPSREAARQFAQSLAQRVRQGESVAKLKQYDNGLSSLNDLKGEGKHHGEIRPVEAEDTLFTMNEGEVRVLEMERGFHLVQLTRREVAGVQPFDEKVQRQIREKLRNDVGSREMKKLVNRLKREAIILYSKDVSH